MRITVITVGKLKEKYFAEASAEYEKRISGYCKLEMIQLEAARLSPNPSQKEIEAALNIEAEKIVKAIPNGSAVVTLCVEGAQCPSEELSRKIEQFGLKGFGNICFIIGGSYGISQSVKELSLLKLSMSEMTFPHRLARIMLLEQIYRAFKISEGSTYHK